jgi:hypothetical protein
MTTQPFQPKPIKPVSPPYGSFHSIVEVTGQYLNLNFAKVNFLRPHEILDLFNFIISLKPLDDNLNVQFSGSDSQTFQYLKRINWFAQLSKELQLKNWREDSSPYIQTKDQIIELTTIKQTSSFDPQRIEKALLNFQVNNELVQIINSQISEVIDNAFSHNLGKWNSSTGPMLIYMAQTYNDSIEFSFSDFGGGFLESLKTNYPELKDEKEAIEIALRQRVTGRPNRKGGNGLYYLSNKVFNGFNGELFIRSGSVAIKSGKLIPTSVLRTCSGISGSTVTFTLRLKES